MKKLIISAIILLFYSNISEAEVKNKLLYNNKVFDLCCNLLEPVYIKTGNSDWCNYGSVWEIKENTLYLLGIYNDSSFGYKKADMKEIFGHKYVNGTVKAEWFTGELRLPDGKVFQQIDHLNIFEKDIAISVEDGHVTKSIVFDNTKKKASSEISSMLLPVLDPDKSVFGIPFGTGEDEFIARFGQPVKSRKSEKTVKEIMYGKKYVFLFEKTKLIGIYTVSHDYEVYQKVPTHDIFDNLDWKLSNGIKQNMNLAEVKKILASEELTISDLPGKTLDVTQKVINLPIEAVKKVAQVITPSKTPDNALNKISDTVQQEDFNTTEARLENIDTTAQKTSLPAKSLEIAAGLPEKTINVTQKVINLPIEAVKKVTQAVIPSKSADNEQKEYITKNNPKISFTTKKAFIEISFKHYDIRKDTDEAYFVSKILVRHK